MKFRTLRADEVECRIARVTENGVQLLLYKDARADMDLLDETVGAMNWTRKHELVGDNLYCTVSIYDEDKQTWISKQDVGTESFTEAVKGRASDSFKRACTNFGIGRELYTAPFIWIPADRCRISPRGSAFTCKDTFNVLQIGYDDNRKINMLNIYDRTTRKQAFVYDTRKKEQTA